MKVWCLLHDISEEQAQNKGTKLISCEAIVRSHAKRKLMLLPSIE